MLNTTVLKVENLAKYYRRGTIGINTLREDINVRWAKLTGSPDPSLSGAALNLGNDGDIWALRDINFMLSEGEILGIIGINGSGKSTLLKIISRITAPSRGTVSLRGKTGSLLEVGTGFHPELTGRENMFLNGAILGMSRAEVGRKLNEIAEFAEVLDVLNTPVKRYSSGMLVRLAFSVAIHMDANILIIDEVLAVGDIKFQKKCLEKIQAAANAGRSVLFVSHNMQSIRRLCHRCLILDQGKITYDGEVQGAISLFSDSDPSQQGAEVSAG